MTDVYLISLEEGASTETVFIGHPLTGGYTLSYCHEHGIFEVAPKEYTDETIRFIAHFGCKAKKIDNRKYEFVESSIDLLTEEIEKSYQKSSSKKEVARRLNNLLSLLN